LVPGRKAWLFADRLEGAQTVAIMHSLVQMAVANGLDPYHYLQHVFEVIPTLHHQLRTVRTRSLVPVKRGESRNGTDSTCV
jgi:transposase IS66-like protein